MAVDRYLKAILTVIAVELFWLGVQDIAPRVSAQTTATPVVITGVQMKQIDGGYLPVAIVGAARQIPAPYRNVLEPVQVRITGTVPIDTSRPLKIEADRPLKVEADRPLKVESVPYTPAPRPGD